MLIYLDLCCFNRPYDEQSNEIVRIETESKLYIQELIKNNKLDLAWSFILDFENKYNPNLTISKLISNWKYLSKLNIKKDDSIKKEAEKLVKMYNIQSKDAIHISCAIKANCDYFLTVDKKLLKRTLSLKEINTINPINFLILYGGKNEE